ncbi:MAG TPA: HTTM domain-containing protein [Urbifossiella sp.]|nr:HTTM domain-containing protein [Urbifossiella sp.]
METHLAAGVFVLLVSGLAAWGLVRRYASATEPAEVLGLFRIGYGVVLFCELAQVPFVRALYPFPVPAAFLAAWLVAVAALTAGFHTRLAAVVNYACTVVAVHHTPLLYHADYLFLLMNLLVVVAPVGRRLSWDARRRGPQFPAEVSRFWSRFLALAGIGFMYAESAMWKWTDPMWTAGLGVWKPASVPQVVWADTSAFLNRRPLMLGLGYLVLAFETAFVVLMWFPRLRLLVCALGVGFHLGIAVVFPLPWFGLLMCAFYLLLLPRWAVAAVARRLRGGAVPPTTGGGLAGGWRRWALTGFVTILLAAQLSLMAGNPLVRRLADKAGRAEAWDAFHSGCFTPVVGWSRTLAGITPHAVFGAALFENKPWLVTVEYRAADGTVVPLPVCRASGLAHPLNSGRVNTTWAFVHSPHVGSEPFARVLEQVTANWAERHGYGTEDARFVVKAKYVERAPDRWERNFLRRQLARPWLEIGSAQWRDGRFSCVIELPPVPDTRERH